MNDIIDSIGLPAMLEQLAEECSELAQASLKYARLLRGENPTPKTEAECLESLTEEIADVYLCMNLIMFAGVAGAETVEHITAEKFARWKERLEARNEEH